MKVALVHYWLVNMAGGEKVLEALCRLYPQADIFTHVVDREKLLPEFRRHKISTTFINSLPASRRLYKKYLPLMPHALEQLDLTDYDLVISSESGPAKGVITRPDCLHVCYCHTPMRYLWDNWPAYMRSTGRLSRLAMRLLLPSLRQWDCLSAQRVDHFVANSRHVARRIRKYWRREAAVVHPPVDTNAFTPRAEPGGEHYLCFGRLASYKRVDLAVEVCTRLGRPLVVAGDGEMMQQLKAKAGPSVRFVGRQDDAAVRELMARSRALLFPGEEDHPGGRLVGGGPGHRFRRRWPHRDRGGRRDRSALQRADPGEPGRGPAALRTVRRGFRSPTPARACEKVLYREFPDRLPP